MLALMTKQEPTAADRLRQLYATRDELVKATRAVDQEIATLKRSWADERGEFLMPTDERMRREVRI